MGKNPGRLLTFFMPGSEKGQTALSVYSRSVSTLASIHTFQLESSMTSLSLSRLLLLLALALPNRDLFNPSAALPSSPANNPLSILDNETIQSDHAF